MLNALDFELIQQLMARHSQTLDFGDAAGFASCFAPDGVLDTDSPQIGLGGVHRGYAALADFVATSLEYSAGLVRQTTFCQLIEGDGDTAKASSFALTTRAYDDPTIADYGRGNREVTRSFVETTGMYFDEFVKLDGRWVFASRQYRQDGGAEVLERVMTPVTIGPRRPVRAAA